MVIFYCASLCFRLCLIKLCLEQQATPHIGQWYVKAPGKCFDSIWFLTSDFDGCLKALQIPHDQRPYSFSPMNWSKSSNFCGKPASCKERIKTNLKLIGTFYSSLFIDLLFHSYFFAHLYAFFYDFPSFVWSHRPLHKVGRDVWRFQESVLTRYDF